ncbi:MAG TPA: prephenate dehydratase [Mycobacteriales bacterium]|nr:prephenate dehydratase [Mycobacteriales bacterium]
MQPSRFAFLGPEGTFTEAALLALPEAAAAERVPEATVGAAMAAVRSRQVDAAVVAFENSVEGSVPVTLDELAYGEPLVIAREIVLPVNFSFVARSALPLSEVRTVAAHPHAEAQCRGWLRATVPDATVSLVGSNAAAAVAVEKGEFDAAITSPIAATRYGLTELATEVADTAAALTRFILVAPPDRLPAPTGADKTSIVAFIRDNHTGALLEVLTEFATRGVNLTRIESRPTKDLLGKYCFFFDCEGHIADARVGDALAALHRICADVRFLGSYARVEGGSRPLPPGRSDADFAESQQWLAKIRRGGGA